MAKAWTFTARGPPSSVLHLTTDLPIPDFPPKHPEATAPNSKPGEQWILIKTSHVALNPIGSGLMRMLPFFVRGGGGDGSNPKTAVPEFDLSGTVLDVWDPSPEAASSATRTQPQPETQRFRKGDEVIAGLHFDYANKTGRGALTSHVAVPSSWAVRKPAECSFAQAATVPVAGATAWLLVRKTSGLRKGGRVVVNGASGGVGTFAVQMAREAVGPEGFVVGVCSGRNEALVRGLGADEIIDYTVHKSVPDELAKRYPDKPPFDAVVDCVGALPLLNQSARFLAETGVYASVGGTTKPKLGDALRSNMARMTAKAWPKSRWLGGVGRTYRTVDVTGPVPEAMEGVAEMMRAGTVRPLIDSEWAFEDALKAYGVLDGGHAKGKVVVRVQSE